jgi:hypothetical protein
MRWMLHYTADTPNPLYAIDDLTAIQVVDGKVDVISGGDWVHYEKEAK